MVGVQTEISLSEELRGIGVQCTPFDTPELIFSVVGILLIPPVTAVTLAFSSLAIETHPIAYLPDATCEGGIAYHYVLLKALATVAPFLVPFVTDMACAVVLLLLAAYVFTQHLHLLPYQQHASNCLRAAGYSGLTWTCFTTLAMTIVRRTSVTQGVLQSIQWILAGATPMAMMFGIYCASERHAGILLELERLRGDWEAHTTKKEMKAANREGGEGSEDTEENEDDATTEKADTHYSLRANTKGPKKTAHSKFFNPRWEMQRAARSGQQAHTIARTLLSMRQQRDLPFLAYVVSRGIDENPTSDEMVLFRLALLRFVFRDLSEASNEERRLTETLSGSSRELKFVLYAFSRRATREYYSMDSNEGGGAMNLMEFDTAIHRARKEHLECLMQLKKFWQCVHSSKRKGGIAAVLDAGLDALQAYDDAVVCAVEEYEGLLERYPRSIPVLQVYASFLDTVINDAKAADNLKQRIETIQNDDFEHDHGHAKDQDAALEKKAARSATTSDSDNSRDKTVRLYLTWLPNILGTELSDLRRLRLYIMLLLGLLICVSAAAYGVSQLWLFTQQAQAEVHLVEAAGKLRAMCISALFYSRSSVLAAISNHTEDVHALEVKAGALAEALQLQHVDNYESITRPHMLEVYVTRNITTMVPIGDRWYEKKISFWEMGNEVARRMRRASLVTVKDLVSTDYHGANISEAKLAMVYAAENVFRSVLPAFERVTKLYELDMSELSVLTNIVVAVSTSIHCIILLLIAFVAIRGNGTTIQAMHHYIFINVMAFSIPAITARKLKDHYTNLEKELRDLDRDEEVGSFRLSAPLAHMTRR